MIRKIGKSKYRVYSRKSFRNMGTYTTKKEAKKRLREIEYFRRQVK